MYLSRLTIGSGRTAVSWIGNAYRVHQRLMMACEGDPRMLFRIEDQYGRIEILLQSNRPPNFSAAFSNFQVLHADPEMKEFHPELSSGRRFRFRLLANPTVKRNGRRHGLQTTDEQIRWLERKLRDSGAELLGAQIIRKRRQISWRNPAHSETKQIHLAVLFEGVLKTIDPCRLQLALETGIGSGKGYGLGLLSLAPIFGDP